MKEFYYNQKMLRNWAIVSLVLLAFVFYIAAQLSVFFWWAFIVKVVTICFSLAVVYVCLRPKRLALIDDEGIVIDSNEKLKWADIEKVERFKKKCFCGRDFIRFKLKKNAKYSLRTMQKLSAMSKYGAFSIPLYAMTANDAKAIEKEIEKHLTLKSKIKSAVKRMLKPSEKHLKENRKSKPKK